MHEFIKVMKGMWTSDDFSFQGEYYSVEHASVPTKSVRAPHVPVFAASRVDEGMNVIAQECDTWFVNYDKNYRLYAESLKRIETEIGLMEQRCAALGRKMHYGINACVLIAETDAEAVAVAEDYLAQLARDPSITSASGGIGANIIGSRKTVIERIRRYQSLGVDLFMMQFYPMRQGLEVFAREILPEIAQGSPRGEGRFPSPASGATACTDLRRLDADACRPSPREPGERGEVRRGACRKSTKARSR
jgi:FMNH2-dependent dimethyl sulfone monooxygenase